MRRALFLLLISLLAAVGTSATAGGAWPRGKGNGFLSVSWTTFGDAVGYVKEISGPLSEKPELELTNESAVYAEYGISERLTFGLDSFSRRESNLSSAILFIAAALGNLDWKNHYGAQIGYGPVRDWLDRKDSVLRAGLAYGRGYQSPWGDGWVEVDGKLGWQVDAEERYWKIDSTLGYNATDRSMLYLQIQSGAGVDGPIYVRAVPTYVRRFGHGISVESAILLGMQNDNAQGLKLGAWLDF
ncbi:hypothetical protein [Tropicimonas isoalkanivorans]|uniref:Uncharacterized protein n=1 Tax=Tropicimonas isoalkanivorans TaxID=441112 RepID=A0A1I1NI00_9RHOB|nr:hypothetical protein [Tropicimonas isoalkanivorans]SFC97157.1 hypothetical protein SAMN04488094_11281 [Tropicimonas isoalkanivorans]